VFFRVTGFAQFPHAGPGRSDGSRESSSIHTEDPGS
jgi:hypothetical protein